MKTVKKYWKPVLVVSAFFIGNRVFNHINAWLGISIIMLTVAFIVYNIIKKLETLNSDIDAEIEKNKSVISTLTSKNTELASLKSNNEGSIKTFAKFLK